MEQSMPARKIVHYFSDADEPDTFDFMSIQERRARILAPSKVHDIVFQTVRKKPTLTDLRTIPAPLGSPGL